MESFQQFSQGSKNNSSELKALVPQTYGPCPCASGEKYKFCCQKAFKPIVFAMCEAEDGRFESALRHMQEAEKLVGRTAEVVCRIAIVWSFFDLEKCKSFIKEAKQLNPKHPRLNYICGINAVAVKEYEEAVSYYTTAIENYPAEDKYHLNETYNNLGTAFYELHQFQNAKDAWEKALVIYPKDEVVRGNLHRMIYNNPVVPPDVREMSPFIAKFMELSRE